jgi:heme oxygenase
MTQTLHPDGSRSVAGPIDPAAAHRRLRDATAAAHQRTEALLDGPTRCTRRDTYHELLQWFGAVHEVFEPALQALDRRVGGRLDTNTRRKLPWLHADLEALGGSPPRTWSDAVGEALDGLRPDRPTVAVGVQYVLEGATLGGRVLASIAGRELGFDRGSGARFLHGYGTATARRWREWWQALPGVVGTADLPTVERSATATFAALERAARAMAQPRDGRTR